MFLRKPAAEHTSWCRECKRYVRMQALSQLSAKVQPGHKIFVRLIFENLEGGRQEKAFSLAP